MMSRESILQSTDVTCVDFSKIKVSLSKIKTFSADNRLPIGEIYQPFAELVRKGWETDLVAEHKYYDDKGNETGIKLPVICVRTPLRGPSIWFIAGIHGEEPAGPIALSRSTSKLEELRKLGFSMVVYFLGNPIGYLTGQRFFLKQGDLSVGDSSHLLADVKNNFRPRLYKPSSKEALSFTKSVLLNSQNYPPFFFMDLHEDNSLITNSGAYVYPEGCYSLEAAKFILKILSKYQEIIMKGRTRFEDTMETIVDGIVKRMGPDYSIDQLLTAGEIFDKSGQIVSGPGALGGVVVETSAYNQLLETRVQAQIDVINASDTIARIVVSEYKKSLEGRLDKNWPIETLEMVEKKK